MSFQIQAAPCLTGPLVLLWEQVQVVGRGVAVIRRETELSLLSITEVWPLSQDHTTTSLPPKSFGNVCLTILPARNILFYDIFHSWYYLLVITYWSVNRRLASEELSLPLYPVGERGSHKPPIDICWVNKSKDEQCSSLISQVTGLLGGSLNLPSRSLSVTTFRLFRVRTVL